MDQMTLDNRLLVNTELLHYFETNDVLVFCDDEEVFEGTIDDFLIDNQYQEDIVGTMIELSQKRIVRSYEHSGYWIFELLD
jgi:alpha-amylase/alpha-mannosidase (GH57 family)